MSSGYEYIITKQIQWAKNRDIPLIGSKGERGRATYTETLEQNLYGPLTQINYDQFDNADGHEVESSPGNPAKMQALHSSSAIAVNFFQYWQEKGLFNQIAFACGFCQRQSDTSEGLAFEEKHRVKGLRGNPPNIDVVIHNKTSAPYKVFALECKFSESYGGRGHNGLNPAYLAHEALWEGLDNLKSLATAISPANIRYTYLDAPQLIRHILALRNNPKTNPFRLLYLWYDVLGKDGADHRAEVDDFAAIAKSDDVKFHAMTYQELLAILDRYYRDDHPGYIQYVTERYI